MLPIKYLSVFPHNSSLGLPPRSQRQRNFAHVTFMYNVAKEAIQTFALKVWSAHGGKMPGSKTGLPASPWQEELNAFSLGTGARTTAERDLAGVGKGGVACGGGSKRIARAGSRPWEHES